PAAVAELRAEGPAGEPDAGRARHALRRPRLRPVPQVVLGRRRRPERRLPRPAAARPDAAKYRGKFETAGGDLSSLRRTVPRRPGVGGRAGPVLPEYAVGPAVGDRRPGRPGNGPGLVQAAARHPAADSG